MSVTTRLIYKQFYDWDSYAVPTGRWRISTDIRGYTWMDVEVSYEVPSTELVPVFKRFPFLFYNEEGVLITEVRFVHERYLSFIEEHIPTSVEFDCNNNNQGIIRV